MYFIFNNFFFENRAFYELMGKKHCTAGQVTGDDMAQAQCVLDINTHSECVIHIAVPRQ
jgi:hypothetical protein